MTAIELFVTMAALLKCAIRSLNATGDTAYASIETLAGLQHFDKTYGLHIRRCEQGRAGAYLYAKTQLLAISDLVLTLANHEQPAVIVECEGIFDLLAEIKRLRDLLEDTEM